MSGAFDYDRSARLKKRSHVRFDRFRIFQLAREHGLKASHCWLLESLCRLCDYKTGHFFGTLSQLEADTTITRKTLNRVLAHLEAEGLIQIVEPFGAHTRGWLAILCFDELVVDGVKVERVDRVNLPAEPPPHVKPFLRASESLLGPSRGVSEEISRVISPESYDVADAQGSNEEGGKGSDVMRDTRDAVALLIREFKAEEVA